ncbi:MAG: carboxymuconolactone decarboxylase family protein [Silicimonas sp.]|nr:carboxymuconolactone decarboxylase family protein [Silicimonas sp.]
MDWTPFMEETTGNITRLAREIPGTAKAFHAMGQAAKTDGALTEQTKELIALGIAIATRCDSCIGFHVTSLVRLKLTREQLTEALAMATYMGGGPSYAYSAKALQYYDELTGAGD